LELAIVAKVQGRALMELFIDGDGRKAGRKTDRLSPSLGTKQAKTKRMLKVARKVVILRDLGILKNNYASITSMPIRPSRAATNPVECSGLVKM